MKTKPIKRGDMIMTPVYQNQGWAKEDRYSRTAKVLDIIPTGSDLKYVVVNMVTWDKPRAKFVMHMKGDDLWWPHRELKGNLA